MDELLISLFTEHLLAFDHETLKDWYIGEKCFYVGDAENQSYLEMIESSIELGLIEKEVTRRHSLGMPRHMLTAKGAEVARHIISLKAL